MMIVLKKSVSGLLLLGSMQEIRKCLHFYPPSNVQSYIYYEVI